MGRQYGMVQLGGERAPGLGSLQDPAVCGFLGFKPQAGRLGGEHTPGPLEVGIVGVRAVPAVPCRLVAGLGQDRHGIQVWFQHPSGGDIDGGYGGQNLPQERGPAVPGFGRRRRGRLGQLQQPRDIADGVLRLGQQGADRLQVCGRGADPDG